MTVISGSHHTSSRDLRKLLAPVQLRCWTSMALCLSCSTPWPWKGMGVRCAGKQCERCIKCLGSCSVPRSVLSTHCVMFDCFHCGHFVGSAPSVLALQWSKVSTHCVMYCFHCGHFMGTESSVSAEAVGQGQFSVLTVWCCTVFIVVTLWVWNQASWQLQCVIMSCHWHCCFVGAEFCVSVVALCHGKLSLSLCFRANLHLCLVCPLSET